MSGPSDGSGPVKTGSERRDPASTTGAARTTDPVSTTGAARPTDPASTTDSLRATDPVTTTGSLRTTGSLSGLERITGTMKTAVEPPRERGFLAPLIDAAAPIDLRILGRTLFHAAVVGLGAGIIGAAFFVCLELVQRLLLEIVCGYIPLRAHGEDFLRSTTVHHYRWWLLLLMPALGALGSGLVSSLAPETRGGGGDAMIDAFHHGGGVIRRRVIWIKAVASVLTLGSGGAGGREGPTMQVGGAVGSTIGRYLGVTERERRLLLVAGVAAGIAAVFRTPLGAALFAAEVLYRDDFESDALIPGVLASVIAYSVVISLFGESTLFAHAEHYPFVIAHLPLYGLLAILVALVAIAWLGTLRFVQRTTRKLPLPAWARPAIGGLALGAVTVPTLAIFAHYTGQPGSGLAILGGGYGAAQLAITGASWLGQGWPAVQVLLILGVVKLIAASLTIGSGGSAGDFAPSLAIGAIFGGAFGYACKLLIHDPRIEPGGFALVGMATLYGGIAHVPLSAMVLVCELAGSYDLLVPLMLAEGIAFVALRKRSLYPAQLPSQRDSPAHYEADLLRTLRVASVMTAGRPFVSFDPATPASEVLQRVSETSWQDVFPVLDGSGKMVGMITTDDLRILVTPESQPFTVAADVMHPPVTARVDDDLRSAAQAMLERGLREIPVVAGDGRILGFLDEADIAKAYLGGTQVKPRPRPASMVG
jgi:CIC family chloride channel protein